MATFPATLTIAGDDLGSPIMLKLLAAWPMHTQLADLGREQLEGFARASRHGWPDRFAARVLDALAVEQLPVRDYLVRAKATTIALTATQLLALRDARRNWERRMGELLLGARREGRAKQPRNPDPGKAIPGGEIYLSCPGLGDVLAARVAGEIGDHIEQFEAANALQCYGGTAPDTRRSGRSEYVVARRLAHNHYLGAASHQWAFCSLRGSGWVREFYDAKIAKGLTEGVSYGCYPRPYADTG
ncbi:transposase [Saccharopolyspora spinosa]|uniref:transposase n=1 Tax=Saccharopolyspora spinosa TaxID=60894 RepID=UPI00031C87E7|nr:transposase [Saccharopolyspora spinosa]